jgi:hypothetical protein
MEVKIATTFKVKTTMNTAKRSDHDQAGDKIKSEEER